MDNKVNSCIAALKNGADAAEKKFGIPSSFTIAQGALESGWLTSRLSLEANNVFGIKADKSWIGKVFIMPTREFLNHTWITEFAHWRHYDSLADCLADHAQFFLSNHRYATALQFPHDGKRFAEEVAKAGYATDPEYSHKIISVINAHGLKDVGAKA